MKKRDFSFCFHGLYPFARKLAFGSAHTPLKPILCQNRKSLNKKAIKDCEKTLRSIKKNHN